MRPPLLLLPNPGLVIFNLHTSAVPAGQCDPLPRKHSTAVSPFLSTGKRTPGRTSQPSARRRDECVSRYGVIAMLLLSMRSVSLKHALGVDKPPAGC